LFYVVAHLHIYPGKAAEFREYEIHALRLVRKHGGELVCAFAPGDASAGGETLTEIHVLRFADRFAFDSFKADPEHVANAHWRAGVICKTDVFVSGEVVDYGDVGIR